MYFIKYLINKDETSLLPLKKEKKKKIADDIVLCAPSRTKLKKMLKKVNYYFILSALLGGRSIYKKLNLMMRNKDN